MNQQPKLLDIVKNKIRLEYYYIRTEEACVPWIKRLFILTTSDIRKIWGWIERRTVEKIRIDDFLKSQNLFITA